MSTSFAEPTPGSFAAVVERSDPYVRHGPDQDT
jgi:hypothetical protein